jgi:acetyl esterase/lipase
MQPDGGAHTALGTIVWAGDGGPADTDRRMPGAGAPIITVHGAPVDPSTLADGAEVIHGRGIDGVHWAMRSLVHRTLWPAATIGYGPERSQFGVLRVPPGSGPHPVVVLYHGGFWREHWTADLMDGLALHLTTSGSATWNVEYRRIPSHAGAPQSSLGGWRDTVADATAALDRLATLVPTHPLDLGAVTVIGHSAGAQLGYMAVKRAAVVRAARLVTLAGALDLRRAVDPSDPDNGVRRFLGEANEAALRGASPIENLPLGVEQVVVHGLADGVVPASMSQRYAEAASAAGDGVRAHWLADVDHMAVIDPGSPTWPVIATALSDSA